MELKFKNYINLIKKSKLEVVFDDQGKPTYNLSTNLEEYFKYIKMFLKAFKPIRNIKNDTFVDIYNDQYPVTYLSRLLQLTNLILEEPGRFNFFKAELIFINEALDEGFTYVDKAINYFVCSKTNEEISIYEAFIKVNVDQEYPVLNIKNRLSYEFAYLFLIRIKMLKIKIDVNLNKDDLISSTLSLKRVN